MEWISVEDRLPNMCDDQKVTVNLFGHVDFAWFDSFFGVFRDRDGYNRHGVTHWMPLPDPPKE